MQRSALIIFFNGIGNALMLVPLLRLLSKKPNSFQYWCAESPFFQTTNLLREADLPSLAGTYPAEWRRFKPEHWPQIMSFIKQHNISHLFHFRNEPAHLELDYNAFKQACSPPLLFVELHPHLETLYHPRRPLSQQILALLEHNHINCRGYSPQWLSREGTGRSRPFVVLFTGASRPHKRWSAANWTSFGHLLLGKTPSEVAVVSGLSEEERALAHRICDGIALRHPHRVRYEAPTSLDVLHELIRTASALVSNDTCAIHLAGAMGLPALGIYLSTEAEIWAPDWNGFVALQSKGLLRCPSFKPLSGNCLKYYESPPQTLSRL